MKIGMVSLGCDKNRVDTEKLLSSLHKDGYEITADPSKSDVIIINTCAFINKAKIESIDTILEFATLKKENLDLKLIVIGCLAERYAEKIKDELPEVDVFAGLGTYDDIKKMVEGKTQRVVMSSRKNMPFSRDRLMTTPEHYAYLKIADGCDNFCSYCAIPFIRGRYHSYKKEQLLEEAKLLVGNGVKELVIVAQDTARYGIDIYGKTSLISLLEELCRLDLYKIRLMYAYPEFVSDDLINMLASEPKMAKYIDIPFQHINDDILKQMNRNTSHFAIQKLIEKIKTTNQNIAIRSSFIVGFPGEDNEKYLELKEFIQNGLIDYAGFFEFSKEEGTVAFKFKNQISKAIASARVKELSKIQSQVICKNHIKFKNNLQQVIYEGIDYDRSLFYGRNEYNAPDIDTKVYFTSDALVEIGGVYNVKIVEPGFHLLGETLN